MFEINNNPLRKDFKQRILRKIFKNTQRNKTIKIEQADLPEATTQKMFEIEYLSHRTTNPFD